MYFWQIHWNPSLSVTLKISSSSRIIWMPRPRDFPEGFTIQAFRRPLMQFCLLLCFISASVERTCSIKRWPLGLLKLFTGAENSSGSSFCFFFFFLAFLPRFSASSFSATSLRFFSSALSLVVRFRISASKASSLRPPSNFLVTSSKFTCERISQSALGMVPKSSAMEPQSMRSSGSVISRTQTLLAVATTSALKVTSTAPSTSSRKPFRMDSAFEFLKFSTNSARSSGSYKSKARG
mmetsp:Transcript_13209/g.34311  ORF Transcript_13209/g.34311 Transcript_13209/m.34311 type:complete len:237 (-) Transcript_13209:795-1505(-)